MSSLSQPTQSLHFTTNPDVRSTTYISGSSSNTTENVDLNYIINDVEVRWGSKVFLRCDLMTDFELVEETIGNSPKVATKYESGSSVFLGK